MKMYIVNKWQLEYNNNKGHFYKSVCQIVSTDIKYVEAYGIKKFEFLDCV